MKPFFLIALTLIFTVVPSTVNGQSRDSLAMLENRLRAETGLLIQNALRDGVISSSEADSLQRIAQYSAGDGVSLTVLRGIIQDLDSLYDASMKSVNTYFEESMTYYRVSSILPSILEIPEEFLSPEERRARTEQEARRRVMTSMANTFEAEKPSTLVEYIIKFSNVFFHNARHVRQRAQRHRVARLQRTHLAVGNAHRRICIGIHRLLAGALHPVDLVLELLLQRGLALAGLDVVAPLVERHDLARRQWKFQGMLPSQSLSMVMRKLLP